MYQVIRERLAKKGHLRKFVDNLSSHRNKILESLNFNYKLTTQTKEIEGHYTGLIIADSIIDIIYPISTLTPALEDKLHEDSYISSGSSNKEELSKQIQNKPQKESNMEFYQDSKASFDEQYFKLALFLFDNEKRINLRLLESLSVLCRRHLSVINCEAYLWKMINKMTNNIEKNIFLEESCELYYLLLIRTKDQTNEQLRSHESLGCLLMTWLKEKEEANHSQVLENNCFQIIKIYFSRCISSWDSLFLYEVMFRIYDKILFNATKLHLLEIIVEAILSDFEMKEHFLRGLFNYLIGYLCITHDNTVSESDKKWFSMSLGLVYDKMRTQYRNILKDSIKVECFKLLNRWINKQYININEFCLFNSQALIFLYISNVKATYKNTDHQQILREYFKIIAKLSIENKKIFIQRVLEEFKEENVDQNEANLLLQLAKEILLREGSKDEYSRSLMNDNSERNGSNGVKIGVSPKHFLISNQNENFPIQFCEQPFTEMLELFLTPIPTKFCTELKLSYLKLIEYVLSQGEEIQEELEGKQKLCEFLTSIYTNLIINSSIGDKYQFVCAVISVLRTLLDRYLNYSLSHQSGNGKNNLDCECLLYSFINKTRKEVKELRNSHIGLIIEAEYMVTFLMVEIEGMLFGLLGLVPKLRDSRKQGISVVNKSYNSVKLGSEKNLKERNDMEVSFNRTVREKMEEINARIKPIFPTESANDPTSELSDLINEMYEHLQNYHRDGELSLNQNQGSEQSYQTEFQNSGKRSQEEKEQYKEFSLIFQRLFASNGQSKRRESQNNIINRHRINSRDSDATSHFSLSNNPHRETSKTNRFSDKSFDEVLDIMHF